MNKLGEMNYNILSDAINVFGTYDPDIILPYCEERLFMVEYSEVREFITWCHENGKRVGRGNYEDWFKEFKELKELKT